jgi:hypothetical protein
MVVGYENMRGPDFDTQMIDDRGVDCLIAWMRSLVD